MPRGSLSFSAGMVLFGSPTRCSALAEFVTAPSRYSTAGTIAALVAKSFVIRAPAEEQS